MIDGMIGDEDDELVKLKNELAELKNNINLANTTPEVRALVQGIHLLFWFF